jgi:hypothetical protein
MARGVASSQHAAGKETDRSLQRLAELHARSKRHRPDVIAGTRKHVSWVKIAASSGLHEVRYRG